MYLVAARYKRKNRLFLVPGDAPGLSWKAAPAMGLRAVATGTLTMEKAPLSSDALLGGKDFDYQTFIDLGQLHWCALAIGACQAALDYLIPYVNEREAFGEPISHRQSVAFMVANIGIELESMRLMVWRAAALAEMGKPFHREAYLAQLLCADKAMEIGTNAVQLLGGHGFTKEHPAERWYRDLRILACINGGMHL
jgi:alkylation response protein AidB-like acyl-CoA dehydrogenase